MLFEAKEYYAKKENPPQYILDEIQELEKELTALKEKEEELQVDANKLQNPDYVARYAREKYLYSKDGEYILQIPDE